jgi:hypothetical protein
MVGPLGPLCRARSRRARFAGMRPSQP